MKKWTMALDILLILLNTTLLVLMAATRKKTAEAVEEVNGEGEAK